MAQRKRDRQRRRARTPAVASAAGSNQREPATEGTSAPAARSWQAARANALALVIGATIVLGALVLYVATAARDIVLGDTPELTAVALTFGVAHPPGYPVFTMLGWLFGQLPVGPLPFRIALLSVVAHAATVGVVYAMTLRFSRSIGAAAVAAIALATEPLFWSWSLVAEVFPLNDLLAVTMLFLAALWHERPERGKLLVAAGLVGGLGMAHHQTIALLSPAILYLMWRRRDVLLRRQWILVNTAIAFIVGLAPYLELMIAAARRPAWSWGDLQGPADLVRHVLRSEYGTGTLLANPNFVGGSAQDRILALLAALDPVQWILLVAGGVYAWRVQRWLATYLLIGFVLAGPAFAVYSQAKLVEDVARAILERFFLMSHVVVAPLAGYAVLWAAGLAARVRLPERAMKAALPILAAAAALALVPLSYRDVDQSTNRVARSFGEDILGTLKQRTIFLAAGDPVVYTVQYLQTIEGLNADVAVIVLPLLPADWYVRELRRAHPDVTFPDDRYVPGSAQFRRFVDANFGRRPFSALGDLPDESTKGVYRFVSRGLVFDVRRYEEEILMDDMVSGTEEAVARYRIPTGDDVNGPGRAWERLTLVDYANAYYRVGREYEISGEQRRTTNPKLSAELLENARRWYRRALEVNPALAEAKSGLARLSG